MSGTVTSAPALVVTKVSPGAARPTNISMGTVEQSSPDSCSGRVQARLCMRTDAKALVHIRPIVIGLSRASTLKRGRPRRPIVKDQ